MRIHEIKKVSFLVFMLGFLAGIIYINLFARKYVISMGIFHDYFLEKYTQESINEHEYMLYLIRNRILPLLFLTVAARTTYRRIAAGVSVLWTSFSAGIILTAAVIKLGMYGVGFSLVSILPHFVCYIAAYMMIIIYMFAYPNIRWDGVKTISIVIFCMLGIISECYVNPVLMDIYISVL